MTAFDDLLAALLDVTAGIERHDPCIASFGMGRRIGLAILTSCLLSTGAAAAAESGETVKAAPASSESKRTVTVAAGSRYRAGWLYGFFLGEHWRDTWTTPVEVPVLDLDAFDGGLRPDRSAGGMETVNLHFKSGNGNTWAFRSVYKEPGRTLDPDTRDSWIGDLIQDETSTAQPYGALMVPPLLDAAGVLHATPQLAVLPDDPRLGEFHQYAGMLGLLEERLERGLEGATLVSDTLTLFQRLEQRGDERVDARAYLRARLIDVLVGDWDRHVFQWRWARFEKDGERLWEPVPRDRDQAFSRFDGVLPFLAEYYTKQLAGFAPGYAPIDKLTFSGRYTDRRFLVALDKKDWEAVTSEVVAKLTDEVISEAVHRLPPPLYEKDGADLEKSLRSRRDALAEVSRDYYRLLADRVEVRGTGEDEEIRIERQAGGAVEVAIYEHDRRTGKRVQTPFFDRTFRPEDTSEIRLYTMGGHDHIDVEGVADETIPVRVVAPGKAVEVSDRSSDPSAIKLYAPLADPPLKPNANPKVDADTAVLVNHYETLRDWGADSLFFPQLSYDSDRGLVDGDEPPSPRIQPGLEDPLAGARAPLRRLFRNGHGEVLRPGKRVGEEPRARLGRFLQAPAGDLRGESRDRGSALRPAPRTHGTLVQACFGRERFGDHRGDPAGRERRDVAGQRRDRPGDGYPRGDLPSPERRLVRGDRPSHPGDLQQPRRLHQAARSSLGLGRRTLPRRRAAQRPRSGREELGDLPVLRVRLHRRRRPEHGPGCDRRLHRKYLEGVRLEPVRRRRLGGGECRDAGGVGEVQLRPPVSIRPGRVGRRRTRLRRRPELVQVARGIRRRPLAGNVRLGHGLPVRLRDEGHRGAFGRRHLVLSVLRLHPVTRIMHGQERLGNRAARRRARARSVQQCARRGSPDLSRLQAEPRARRRLQGDRQGQQAERRSRADRVALGLVPRRGICGGERGCARKEHQDRARLPLPTRAAGERRRRRRCVHRGRRRRPGRPGRARQRCPARRPPRAARQQELSGPSRAAAPRRGAADGQRLLRRGVDPEPDRVPAQQQLPHALGPARIRRAESEDPRPPAQAAPQAVGRSERAEGRGSEDHEECGKDGGGPLRRPDQEPVEGPLDRGPPDRHHDSRQRDHDLARGRARAAEDRRTPEPDPSHHRAPLRQRGRRSHVHRFHARWTRVAAGPRRDCGARREPASHDQQRDDALGRLPGAHERTRASSRCWS